ncbi:uncharacterized protein LOC125075409 [Vanessa atalanta]|uniref:uncharacterized protein LOC125075409 n=1 Tax=Vanessa atalanta TaxID=42275 RepID=UPI001FCD515C|nr:uncharacterized protein LOC125075409 [Vanessa atalanta]
MLHSKRLINSQAQDKEKVNNGILVHLVTKYKDLIENKKTDAVTTAIKNEGWKKLAEEFNCLSSFYVRNVEQLKTCWDNIKRTTRKDKAATKKNNLLTGGGRSDIPPPGPLQGQVEVLLGPTLDGLENPYDSDIQFIDQGLTGPKTLIEMINKSVNSHSEIYYNIEIIASQNTLFLFIYQDVVVTDSEKQTILDVNAATSSKTSQDSTQEDKGCTLQTNEIKDDNI